MNYIIREGEMDNMFLSLDEKADYEFEKFKAEKIHQPKDGIFAASYEIEIKKSVYRHLRQAPYTDKEKKWLISVANLTDLIFSEMEKERLYGDENIKICIAGILKKGYQDG